MAATIILTTMAMTTVWTKMMMRMAMAIMMMTTMVQLITKTMSILRLTNMEQMLRFVIRVALSQCSYCLSVTLQLYPQNINDDQKKHPPLYIGFLCFIKDYFDFIYSYL